MQRLIKPGELWTKRMLSWRKTDYDQLRIAGLVIMIILGILVLMANLNLALT